MRVFNHHVSQIRSRRFKNITFILKLHRPPDTERQEAKRSKSRLFMTIYVIFDSGKSMKFVPKLIHEV